MIIKHFKIKVTKGLFFMVFQIIFLNSYVIYSQSIKNNCSSIFPYKSEKYKTLSVENSTKFTLALLPMLFIPNERELSSLYSIGFGFTFNASYELTKNIKISGNIETILSKFKVKSIFDSRSIYETLSQWYSIEVGPKFYFQQGMSRIYLNSHFKYTQIYHGSGNYIILVNNPDHTLGFNFGFGIEIPVNNFVKLDINPSYNILYPVNNKQLIYNGDSYYRILIGLSHNF